MPDWFSYLDVASALVAAGLWLIWPQLGFAPLLLGLMPWAIRLVRTGRATVKTSFDLPIILFLLTAAISVWSAFDKDAAWAKWWLICSAVLIFYAFANWSSDRKSNTAEHQAWILSVVGATISIIFIVTIGFNADSLNADQKLHPNLVAGTLAMLAPFAVAALLFARKEQSWQKLIGSVLILGVIVTGVVISLSRGAWAATAIALLLSIWWVLSGRIAAVILISRRWVFLTPILSLIAIAILLFFFFRPLVVESAEQILPNVASGLSRVEVYRNSLTLAAEYPFIGAGLNSFVMLYPAYAFLIHVNFLLYSHNLFLDISIEQGVFALLALTWMCYLMLKAIWCGFLSNCLKSADESNEAIDKYILADTDSIVLWAAAMSLVIVLLHGLIDDALYSSRFVVLFFVPFAFSVPVLSKLQGWHRQWFYRSSLVVLGVALLLVLIFWKPLNSIALANMAAIQQSQAELSIYSWPEWKLQDEVRRQVDLENSISLYEQALIIDTKNTAANRRLGQIALSMGWYDLARTLLVTAYQQRPWDNAIRQMLGEALIINGQQTEGEILWASVNNEQDQLEIRRFWYDYINEPEFSAFIQRAIEINQGTKSVE
jgi:O-antigen ligase